ncbi:MAG: hypothetical protein WCA56_10580 [Xanthobacteraceae bacterium]|jgi:hypothetical protein
MRAWQALAVVSLSLLTSIARAETVEISGDYGGFVVAYEAKWKKLATEHAKVRIAGPCVSACTIVAGYIPRGDICVTPNGSLGFHLAFPYFVTPTLWKDYPPDIQEWITQKGGLTYKLMWLQAPEIYKFFKKCPQGT